MCAGPVMLGFAWLAPVVLLFEPLERVVTAAGTEFLPGSALPLTLFTAFTVTPIIVFAVYLIGIGSTIEKQPARRHTLLIPLGLLFLVFLLVLDFIPLTGAAQFAVQSLYVVDAVLLYVTYFDLDLVERYTINTA